MDADQIIRFSLKSPRVAKEIAEIVDSGILLSLADDPKAQDVPLQMAWQHLNEKGPPPFDYREWRSALINTLIPVNPVNEIDSALQMLQAEKSPMDVEALVVQKEEGASRMLRTLRSATQYQPREVVELEKAIRDLYQKLPESAQKHVCRDGSLDEGLAQMRQSIKNRIALNSGIAAFTVF
jgi:hypothetical protein